MNALEQAWLQAWHGIGAEGEPSLHLRDLVARYREPHRRYHTLEAHIGPALALLAECPAPAARSAPLAFAFFYHDAVYDPRAADNEERSAALAEGVASGAGVEQGTVEAIARLVMATKHAQPEVPLAADEQVIRDVDLAVLGSAGDVFDAYEAGIRAEYAFVPDAAFRDGRSRILRTLLARDAIYLTPWFRDRFEAPARSNLERSLRQLA